MKFKRTKKIQTMKDYDSDIKKDRIEKNKLANNKVVKILLVFVFFALILLGALQYFKIGHIEVKGNYIYSDSKIITVSQISHNDNILFIDTKAIEKKIEKNIKVNHVKVEKNLWDKTLEISVKELHPVAYLSDTNKVLLNNTVLVGDINKYQAIYQAPYVIGPISKNQQEKLTKQLLKMKESDLKLISQIFISDNNTYKLYMNDQNTIYIYQWELAEKIKYYFEITQKIGDEKGNIYLQNSTYFKAYGK